MQNIFFRLLLASGLLSAMMLCACSSKNPGQKKNQEIVSTPEHAPTGIDYSKLAGKIADHITCDAQPQLSYCLYLPSAYSVSKTFPVIFIFDALLKQPAHNNKNRASERIERTAWQYKGA